METSLQTSKRTNRVPWAWLSLVFIATIILYLPSLQFSLTNYDDHKYITDNPYIRLLDITRVGELLTTTYFVNYHPLTLITYAIDYTFVGIRPAAYRFQNILWHAGAVVILAILLRRRFATGSLAFLLAFLWGATPLRYESVVWLSERKDVLSVFFFLLAYAFHASADRMNPTQYTRRALPWEIAALILALLAKSMAITYIAVAITHDLLLARNTCRSRIPAYALLALLCVGFALANLMAQESTIVAVEGASIPRRLALAVQSVWHHLSRTILPIGLSPAHPQEYAPKQLSIPTALGLALTIFALIAIIHGRNRAPHRTLGIAFFLLTLAPVSGLIPTGFSYVADRYSYLPTAGIVLAVGATCCTGNTWKSLLLPAILSIGILAARPVDAMFTWASSTALWTRVLTIYPDFQVARLNIASARYREFGILPKETDLADVKDTFGLGIREQLAAQSASEKGNLTDAIATLENSPSQRVRLRGLAKLHAQAGNTDQARQYALELADIKDAQPEDIGTAASCLITIGDLENAARTLTRARKPSLQSAQTMGQLANLLLQTGDTTNAEQWLRIAERIDPAQYDITRARSTLHARNKELKPGMDYCEHILARPDVPTNTYHFLLGMYAYFAETSGDPAEALSAIRLAVQDGTQDEPTLVNAIRLAKKNGDANLLQRAARRLDALKARNAVKP